MHIEAGRSAVLALHFQEDIVGTHGAFAGFFAEQVAARQVIPATRALLDGARRGGLRVVHVRVCWPEGHAGLVVNNALLAAVQQTGALVDGAPGAEIVAPLAPAPGEAVVSHTTMSPFEGGDLAEVLAAHDVQTVALAGVATNVIVEEVARGIVARGLRAIVLEDCCAAATPAAHAASVATLGLLASEVGTSHTLLDALSSAPQEA